MPSSPASSAAPVPVVLVGCGAVSQLFYLPTLRALSARGELAVHSLVDPSAAARAVLAAAFPAARPFDSLAACEAPAGSLVIIATPPRFHAAQSIEAFARGWHVLCEKPMASDLAECERMIAAARDARRLLAVGLYKRFFPSSVYLKTLFDQGQLGALRSFTIAEGGPFRWPAATPSFFNKAQTPGGVLLDIGVHVLDLLLWWLGDPARFTYRDDAMGGLETNAVVELHYGGGAHGRVHLSRDWATANEYHFHFERGSVRWKTNDANGLTVGLAGTPSALRAQLIGPFSDTSPADVLQPSNPQSFILQLSNVLAAVRGRETLRVPGEEGLRSLRLIESCYRRREWLEQPWFTEAEAARARILAAQP